MLTLHSSARKIDTAFVSCLFLLFAVTSCILILIGAEQYRATTDAMKQNYEVRTTVSYLKEKLHQNDTCAETETAYLAGGYALVLTNSIDGNTYSTYIYYYDGALRELSAAETSAFTPDSGQVIVTLESFDAEIVRPGLVRAVFKDTYGISHTLYLNVHSATPDQRKENL